jgi:hypothetical protein
VVKRIEYQGGITILEISRFPKKKAFRSVQVACLFVLCFAFRLPAQEEDPYNSERISGSEIETTSESVLSRMRINLSGGFFYPVGKWADGFDPGVSIGAGFDLPLRERIDIGGRFSRFALKRDDQTTFKWLSVEAQATFYPPIDFTRAEPFVLGRSGLLQAAVEVGEGREDEWDFLVGVGGGVRVPFSEDFRFLGTVFWSRVMGEGQGFHFTGGLSFPVF